MESKATNTLQCVWYVKDTNLKANHNFSTWNDSILVSVFDMSKIQI